MRYLIFIVFIISLTSCKWPWQKPSCDLTDKYATIAGKNIATILVCRKPDAIAADLKKTISDLNLCTKPVEAGAISGLICKPVSTVVAQMIVQGVLPSRWECSGGVPAQALETFLYNACSALPF